MENNQKIIKIESDIAEIDSVLYNPLGFDIEKAKQIISKHNCTNAEVATLNSPMRAGWIPFEQATPGAIKNNLIAIRGILQIDLAREIEKTFKS